MKVENAKTLPRIFYGLHMVEGVAEYRDEKTINGEAFRLFISDETIRNMSTTFQGRPVFVHHVDKVELENIEREADGYVVESFFNKADGKHWAKFIVTSDRGHEAIRSGWKLSNAYLIKESAGGGLWHGVDYSKEVTRGEYEHMAIVPNPRYSESIILTPEEFKKYNEEKEQELLKIANSKGARSMFNLFKREKVANAADIEQMMVLLPKSQIEKSITQIINEADEAAVKMQMPEHMANGDHMVDVAGEKMTVNQLIEKHCALKASMTPAPAAAEEKPANEEAAKPAAEEKPANEEKPAAEEKPQNEDEEKEEEKKAKNSLYFDALKNAEQAASIKVQPATLELSQDMIARGKSRYGSN